MQEKSLLSISAYLFFVMKAISHDSCLRIRFCDFIAMGVCVYWWYGASMVRLYQCAHLWHAHTMNYTFIYLSFFFFVASFGAMREIRFACDTCTTDEEFELRAYFFH